MKRLIAAGLIVAATLASAAMAVETSAFKQVLRDGDFELRDYPALVVAEVTVTGDQKEAASKGFRLLAGYIFGGNKKRQSIAMTAPVAQRPVSEKIAMTAPVAQTQTAVDTWVIRFTMPSTWSLQTLPIPNDSSVKLRDTAPARFAVLQFSGVAAPDSVVTKSSELLAWVKSHELDAIGPVTLAQYNPPWTLWFMRRNEVMVEVKR
ncbi:heme-binding protein [Rhodanobacter sp. AS-Z3]|uniref:SOUL family heme-binding protein n=1 Tax=Rhodanobacter sp. AS-Z3 TaxID=3031330 RepID=UPI00247B1FE5|nr:heme-binding protein [Rhodanobacter sp. AS-Z3]WEN14285.1 heme-binding protein [Rhodanobacter sp. AS-Z3]